MRIKRAVGGGAMLEALPAQEMPDGCHDATEDERVRPARRLARPDGAAAMNRPRHWQDPVNACVGVAILVSPWWAGYAAVQPALANAVIVGLLLFTVAVAAAVIGRPWVEFAVVGLGAWMLESPWALAFEDETARRTAVAAGSLVLLLGTGTLLATLLKRPGGGSSAKH